MVPSPLNVDILYSTFENRIQFNVQQGNLQQDDFIHQLYLQALRDALEAATATSRHPSSHSGPILEPSGNPGSLEQAYPSLSIQPIEPMRNLEERLGARWLDLSSIPEASSSSSQVDPRNNFLLSPEAPTVTPPRPTNEEYQEDLDPFFEFYIDSDAPEISVPSPYVDNYRESYAQSSGTQVQANQDFFAREEHIDDDSLEVPLPDILRGENKLEFDWKGKHTGSKRLNTNYTQNLD
jgi:hypothetical protein